MKFEKRSKFLTEATKEIERIMHRYACKVAVLESEVEPNAHDAIELLNNVVIMTCQRMSLGNKDTLKFVWNLAKEQTMNQWKAFEEAFFDTKKQDMH